ncbi:MAG: sigma-70 family RNA polymerase sigma factor [Planctomycetota bacterium]
MTASRRSLERAARSEWAAVLAVLARDVHDLALAEDAVQEAFVAAMERWPKTGAPARPAAWLTVVARRAALRRLRRDRSQLAEAEVLEQLEDASQVDPAQAPEIPDARLALLCACCHRSLSLEAQVALTLRTVSGLTTREIAHAFWTDEATMAQRLVRARTKVQRSKIPFEVPPPERIDEALSAVLGVLYLTFNEGYAATGGPDRVRIDLCAEGVRLALLVAELCPDRPEALGLASLTLAHHARRAARVGDDGRSVPLEEQDRALYDQGTIARAEDLLRRATALDAPGPYQVEAAIACAHACARSAEETDWALIASLYAALAVMTPSPFVELNRAVAVGLSDGPDAGIALLERLHREHAKLTEHHLLHSALAELHRRAGRRAEAHACYERAIALAPPGGTREDLEHRRAGLPR